MIAYGFRGSGNRAKAGILGLVPRISLGTAFDLMGEIPTVVRLAILGASTRMTEFTGNPPCAIHPGLLTAPLDRARMIA